MQFIRTIVITAVLACVLACAAFAQTAALLLPQTKAQFFDNSGLPLSGGKVYSYEAGTSTPQSTFTDSGGSIANPNPVILDSAGRAAIWLTSGLGYKFSVRNSADVVMFTTDNVTTGSASGYLPLTGGTVSGNLSITGTATLNNLVVSGTCTGAPCLWTSVGSNVSLVNGAQSLDTLTVRNQSTGDTTLTVRASSGQSAQIALFKTAANATVASVDKLGGAIVTSLISNGGAVNALVNGATIGFQVTNTNLSTPIQMDGVGNISAAGSYNATGGTGVVALKIGGTTVIDGSRNATVNDLTINGTCTGCGGGGGGGLPVSDATNVVYKAADATARMKFSATGISAASTRTWTIQDVSLTVAGIDAAQTWSAAQTFSAVVTGNAGFAGTVFNSTAAGATHGFQLTNSNFIVDGAGNITASGNLINTGYITTGSWVGLPVTAGTPGTTPGSGFGAITYKGGVSGLEVWIYDTVNVAWSAVDLAGVAGGVTTVNGFTGAVTVAGTANQVVVGNSSGTITLSTPQSIATTSNVTFGTVVSSGVVQSNTASGAGIAFQVNNSGSGVSFPFQVSGVGNISAAGSYNATGGTGVVALKIGGTTVIDGSRNATVANLTVSGVCTGCGAGGGVTSLNAMTGVLTVAGTANQVSVSSGFGTVTLSTPQSIATSSSVTFANVTTGSGGVFQSGATGASTSFQNTNGNFQVNGNGTVSAAGVISSTGVSGGVNVTSQTASNSIQTVGGFNANSGFSGTNSYSVAGTVVINSNRQFVGSAVNVGTFGGIAGRAFNPYDAFGTLYTGQDYVIGFNSGTSKFTVNGSDVTSIKFVGGSLVTFTP